MTSKEALEKEIDYLEIRKQTAYRNEYYSVYQECEERINNLKQIKQDLERLEALEKENKELLETIEIRKQMNINLIDFGTKIKQENERLKKHNGRLTRKIQNLYDEHANLICELSLLRSNNDALLKLIGVIEVKK